jgi:hypothetical protein
MAAKARVSFPVRLHQFHGGGTVAVVTPSIDGVSMTEMISTFERQQKFEPGGYEGLVPRWFNFGPWDRYLLGEDHMGSPADSVDLLGCSCGELGCWPLNCRIERNAGTVVWDRFAQPHRPARDYSQFGPFVFDLDQYREAIAELEVELSAQAPDARSG